MRIGIIGSAGREKPARWTKQVYFKAYHRLEDLLDDCVPNVSDRDLVSGGAARADHLAVSLFLAGKANSLTLCLPVGFCTSEKVSPYHVHPHRQPFPGFYDTGRVDVMENPGGTLNYYHRLFSKDMGSNTLDGIARAIAMGAKVDTSVEFLSGQRLLRRNLLTGRVDRLYALTWSEGVVPGDGGTGHCWGHSAAEYKLHIPLSSL